MQNGGDRHDGEQEVSPDVKPPVITDKASLCEAVRQSGCCGMGGAGFPTHIKLNFDENKYKVDTLVIKPPSVSLT